jgi:Rrf2 family protein
MLAFPYLNGRNTRQLPVALFATLSRTAMLTMKTRYALKALAILAERGTREPTLLGEVADREAIPRKFLEAILRELKQHGFLAAQRGRGGGYTLLHRPQDIRLADVIRALDGPLAPVPCLSKTAYRPCEECRSERACGVRLVLQDLHEATSRVLEGTTLADLVRRTHEAMDIAARAPSYSI